MFVLLLIEGLRDRAREIQGAREDTVTLTRLALRDLEAELVATKQLLTVLTDLPEIRSPVAGVCDRRLAQLIARYEEYATFGVALPDGRVTCASRAVPPQANAGRLEWFRDVLARHRFSVGTYERGLVSGLPVVVMALPVSGADGRLIGVVFASLRLTFFERFRLNTPLRPGAVLTMFDREGTVLARFPNAAGFVGRRDPNAQITRYVLERHEGAAELRGLDGTPRVYSFTPLPVGQDIALYASAGIESRLVYARANATLRFYLTTVTLLGLVLLALTLRAGRRLILRPLLALRETAARLAGGDLGARASLAGAPLEIQGLGVSFNRMADALEGRLAENARLTRDLEQRVLDRTAQLRSSNEALEAFAHYIAHDLRSPLGTIHGFTSLVLQGSQNLSPAERADLRRVLETAEHMDGLIRDLLTFSRLARTEFPLTRVDLNEVVRMVVLDARLDLERTGARLDVAPDLPAVRANEAVLRQVLLNLLGNALKFTAPGAVPRVRVGAVREGDVVRVSVEDGGIGIREADQARVFAVFERLHPAEAYPGTGIGLAIVRQGVERMGGQVGVTSVLGKGSRFWFTLPTAGSGEVLT